LTSGNMPCGLPRGTARRGIQGGMPPRSQGAGPCPAREGEAGSEATVGRGKREAGSPSKLTGPEKGSACPFIDIAARPAVYFFEGMTSMKLILRPTRIRAAGNKAKIIEEFVGRVNSQTSALSVARMRSPEGWLEPGQRPEFDEVTLVLKGRLIVRSKRRKLEVREGQAVIVKKGEWVQYSTPEETDYLSICHPAFSPDLVHRDEK